jgi:hypothetical protein
MPFKVALAYIDPVSGSILIQAIVAAAAGSVAFFRKSIWRVFRHFTVGEPPGPPAAPAPPADRDPKG